VDNTARPDTHQPAGPQAEVSAEAKRTWHVRTPSELEARCLEIGTSKYLVDGLIPERSLSLVIGNSGLGKSPLLYQLAICVAAGVPFLGLAVQRRRVLYLDFEDGIFQVRELTLRLSRHLGLEGVPEDLLLWNGNDAPVTWDSAGRSIFQLINDIKPGLVIVDPLTALRPEVEDTNSAATEFYQELRKSIRRPGCCILGSHHRRKDETGRGKAESVTLAGPSFRQWFQAARGSSVLINGVDIRLGVEAYFIRSRAEQQKNRMGAILGDESEEVDTGLLVRGYARGSGEIPPIRLARVFEQGEPVGYQRLCGAHLLANRDQEDAYEKLQKKFTFKEAMFAYQRTDQPTKNFLLKCIAAGLLKKVAIGVYQKLGGAE
jgi:hypothetical protein